MSDIISHQENSSQTYSEILLLLSCFSCVWLCATPKMAVHQAPLSLGFSRQEHWSGLPFPSPTVRYLKGGMGVGWREVQEGGCVRVRACVPVCTFYSEYLSILYWEKYLLCFCYNTIKKSQRMWLQYLKNSQRNFKQESNLS